MKLSPISLLFVLALPACTTGGGSPALADGGADAVADDPIVALCRATCSAPANGYRPCADLDVEACVDSCKLQTNGLAATCARCVVEHTTFRITYCDGCNTCTAGAGKGSCMPRSEGEGDACCSEADESCGGPSFPKTTDPAPCGTYCP